MSEENKNHKPTPHKLQEAKKKGQVAKSLELNVLGSNLVLFLVVLICFAGVSGNVSQLFCQLLSRAHLVQVEKHTLIPLFQGVVFEALGYLVPLVLLVAAGSIVLSLLQTGFVFAPGQIKWDFNKINPKNGLKRIFSKKTLFELIKNSIKLCVVAASIVWGVDLLLAHVGHPWISGSGRVSVIWHSALLWVVGLYLLISLPGVLLDAWFSRWDFTKKMMMSQREVKDEHKKREGNPEVKSKQKQLQQELLKKSASLNAVKDSDVIITNPTHLAVALKYDMDTMVAPKVVAMGHDRLASRIRVLGRRHRVPLIENKPLARKLYRSAKLDGYVPAECYQELAAIFRGLYVQKGATQR